MASDPPLTTTCDHFMVFVDDANDPLPTEPEIVVAPPHSPSASARLAATDLPAPETPPSGKLPT
jgi:hypothetical protein